MQNCLRIAPSGVCSLPVAAGINVVGIVLGIIVRLGQVYQNLKKKEYGSFERKEIEKCLEFAYLC